MQAVQIASEIIGLMDVLGSLNSRLGVLIEELQFIKVIIPAYILLGVVFGAFLREFLRFVIKVFSRGKL